MSQSYQKVLLIILDGFGLGANGPANAVTQAKTPFLKEMYERFQWTSLSASGVDVGLPPDLMGNSEVGHLNLGAGRIVNQEIRRIDRAIETGDFYDNPVILDSIHHARSHGTAWHLIGLISDGGVHSSLNHLFALLEMAKREGLERVFVHALMDGRDSSPHGGKAYITAVEEKMDELGLGKIATVCGRYWAMDRDQRWDRVAKAYRMLTSDVGLPYNSALKAIEESYHQGVTDEFIEPSIIMSNGQPVGRLAMDDSILFFNFRADRARELTLALTDPDFSEFNRPLIGLHYTSLTEYNQLFKLPVAFKPHHLNNILGQVISNRGLRQFRIAETEKYAHVTFFFNGGEETALAGEDRKLIPSPKVPTYDLQPEMSAPEVTESALAALDDDYTFILLNYANPDMVGHTGVQPAVLKALESLDPLVETLTKKALDQQYAVLLTSDHGNSEQMLDREGNPHTAHTTNRVPFVVMLPDGLRSDLRVDGILADVAPTILKLLQIPQPFEMTGRSLII